MSKEGCDLGEEHLEEGRDFVNSATPKPGYTSYTYPHPLTRTDDPDDGDDSDDGDNIPDGSASGGGGGCFIGLAGE